MTDYVDLFANLVMRIENIFGEASSKSLAPAGRERIVSAVWFVDGSSHGLQVLGSPEGLVGPRVNAWGGSGDVGFITLVPPGPTREVSLFHLELAAASVGLLPYEVMDGRGPLRRTEIGPDQLRAAREYALRVYREGSGWALPKDPPGL
jgi:hypothetical protein